MSDQLDEYLGQLLKHDVPKTIDLDWLSNPETYEVSRTNNPNNQKGTFFTEQALNRNIPVTPSQLKNLLNKSTWNQGKQVVASMHKGIYGKRLEEVTKLIVGNDTEGYNLSQNLRLNNDYLVGVVMIDPFFNYPKCENALNEIPDASVFKGCTSFVKGHMGCANCIHRNGVACTKLKGMRIVTPHEDLPEDAFTNLVKYLVHIGQVTTDQVKDFCNNVSANSVALKIRNFIKYLTEVLSPSNKNVESINDKDTFVKQELKEAAIDIKLKEIYSSLDLDDYKESTDVGDIEVEDKKNLVENEDDLLPTEEVFYGLQDNIPAAFETSPSLNVFASEKDSLISFDEDVVGGTPPPSFNEYFDVEMPEDKKDDVELDKDGKSLDKISFEDKEGWNLNG